MTLTPGFLHNSYFEQWGIWIDLNDDMNFSTSEQLYGGNGNTVVNAYVIIPPGVTGVKRMRVVMKYGTPANACGTFYYGEVEDYTVVIN